MRIMLVAAVAVLSSPAWAFHSSSLAPDIKQGIISMMEQNPAQQNQVREWGNFLAGQQEACNYGNQQACQNLEQVRGQMRQMGALTGAPPAQSPMSPPYPPGGSQMPPSNMPGGMFPMPPSGNTGNFPQQPPMGNQGGFPQQQFPQGSMQPPMGGQQQFPQAPMR